MRSATIIMNALVGASALIIAGAHFAPDGDHTGPVLNAAVAFVTPKSDTVSGASVASTSSVTNAVGSATKSASKLAARSA